MKEDLLHIHSKECEHHTNHFLEPTDQSKKRYRLADFFDAHWESYLSEPHPALSKEQIKAVSSIRVCRTAVLGVDEYVCKGCGQVVAIYHSCRNRFCPTCSWGDTIKWAKKLESQMMDLPHRHVVVTLPHALNGLAKSNGKEILNILMRTAADTFKDWVAHKYKLKIGVISVLHTFGETKEYHLHVHMIVSWGGISTETGKLISIKGDYVNYEFLQKKFRNKFEDELIALYDSDRLYHKFSDRVAFLQFIRRINKTNWILHIEPPMDNASAVIRYIGRYSKRACLSERKITGIDGEYISFSHKDYKRIGENKRPLENILELHYKEFFPRLLQHVPLPYFRLVRYYGVYSTKSTIPAEYLNKNSSAEEEQWEWKNPFICNICQTELEYVETVFDIRPPGLRIGKFDINIHPSYIYKRA
jgi:hypothetical protein